MNVKYVPMTLHKRGGNAHIVPIGSPHDTQIAYDPEMYMNLLILGNGGKFPLFIESKSDMRTAKSLSLDESRLVLIAKTFVEDYLNLKVRDV